LFNGDIGIDEGSDDPVNNGVLSASIEAIEHIAIGVSYILNIGDTDGLQGELLVADLQEAVGGVSLSVTGTFEPVKFTIEYVGALKEFDPTELDFDTDGEGDMPSSVNVEIAYMINDTMEAALRYTSISEFIDFTGSQIGIGFSYSLLENSTLAFEILSVSPDEDFTGNDDRITVTTVQFAVEF
jgi:hypothetical protein